MKKVFVYVLEYSEWKNRSQLEFSNLTLISKATKEKFIKDCGNLWVYFHERLRKHKKQCMAEDFIIEGSNREITIAYGYGDSVSKQIKKLEEQHKKEQEKQKLIEKKKHENDKVIMILDSVNPECNNWYIKDREFNITSIPTEALAITLKEFDSLYKKFRQKYPNKMPNGAYKADLSAVGPKKWLDEYSHPFRGEIVDGRVDDVKYDTDDNGYSYEVMAYSKGKLLHSYRISVGGDEIENTLGKLYPNAGIPWEA